VDTPERIGAFLDLMFENNRFFSALEHAPKLKVAIEKVGFFQTVATLGNTRKAEAAE
jgi:hypothetical protein